MRGVEKGEGRWGGGGGVSEELQWTALQQTTEKTQTKRWEEKDKTKKEENGIRVSITNPQKQLTTEK